ncbi:MAG: InlB B-repeat-containing protein, partial [Verrucomicrobiia bacterium]
MHSSTSKLLWLVSMALLCCRLAAQPAPTPPRVVVSPPANTIMLTQTVQAVFLTVTNYDSFTNLVSMMRVVTNTVQLLDDGVPPDANASDGVYSGSLVVPAFAAPTNFVVRFTTYGQDISITNDMGELLPESWATNITDVTYMAVVRPANDNFANAIKIPPGGGTVTGSNEFATIEPAEPFHAGNPYVGASIWWTWSPTNNTSVLIDTAGSGFEPVLAVYTGASLDVLRPVAASTNDVEHGLKAYVVFDAAAGVTYRIAVAGYTDADVGLVRLRVVPDGLPDTVAPEVEIVEPVDTILTNAVVRVAGVALDSMPHGTGVSSVTVQLNDDPPLLASGTTNWNLSLTLSPGTNFVSVVAEDVAGNRSEPVLLMLYYSAVPNDDFAGALELSGFSGSVTAMNDFATREIGEPMHANNEGGHSVWYWFRAPATGVLRLTTQGSSIDTLLAVYEGSALTDLVPLAANDDASPGSGYSELTAALARNRVYYIAIDGFGGSTGRLALEYEFEPTEIMRTLNVIAGPGGSAVPAPGLVPHGSIQVVTALPERGFVFAGWQGSVNTTQNPLVLVMDKDITLTASFRVVECTEGFESGGFSNRFAWASNG